MKVKNIFTFRKNKNTILSPLLDYIEVKFI